MRKEISLADLAIGIDLRFPEYEALFDRFPAQKPPEIEVSVSPQALAAAQKLYEPGSGAPYIEYMELCPKLSDAMLPFNRVFFHGTAFLWRGKAWIFAAVSGTGKTTQYLHWKALYGEEVQIINGDKPVLAFDDGNITVHPSPWNGKEGMGQDPPLPAAFNFLSGLHNPDRSISYFLQFAQRAPADILAFFCPLLSMSDRAVACEKQGVYNRIRINEKKEGGIGAAGCFILCKLESEPKTGAEGRGLRAAVGLRDVSQSRVLGA